MSESSSDGRGRPSKVARLIDEYGMETIGKELERRWTADENERDSLRDLARLFNERLLESTLAAHEEMLLEGEVSNMYQLLTDEDASSGAATRAQRRLNRAGIDVEQLRSDFVSHQAIQTYLQNHRGAEYGQADRDPLESTAESLNRLRTRTETVTRSKVERLRDRGAVELGDFNVIVDLQIVCNDCGTSISAIELIEQGHCSCTAD